MLPPTLDETLSDPLFSIDTPLGVAIGPENENQEILEALAGPIDGNVATMTIFDEPAAPELAPAPRPEPDIDESTLGFLDSLSSSRDASRGARADRNGKHGAPRRRRTRLPGRRSTTRSAPCCQAP